LERIFKGATRPALLLGVPLVPAIILAFGGVILAANLWLAGMFFKAAWLKWSALVPPLIVVPVLLWMRMATRKDDQRVRQLLIAARLSWWCGTRSLWKCRSYSPIDYREGR
jgi:type IV secretion system protein VirB3